ncbi:MAG: NAD-dependent epimerase/dehydratase family protein [Candidatus Heimdallarchaeota archaeon]|nr:NAD-dependent epimerase/dehydratase family protein [Candidatus Heimdallarchaeota archaeon]MCK5142882.1 NAD-dependent epimerase/dehydratase family protein [Candidatus Heimdallarchaeota archaeon]
MKKYFVTGSYGQIGMDLIPAMLERYGKENVIATGRKKINPTFKELDVIYHRLDVRDHYGLRNLLVEYDIDIILHNASVLSATGEKNPQLAHAINFEGFYNVLEATRELNLEQLFAPSSIAAFGPTTPLVNTPNDTIMQPTTIYGISKVYVELMGEYYNKKYGLNFRSLRYPGVLSPEEPGGGTTDYSIFMFYEALKNKKYECFLGADVRLPMMMMSDCLKCTFDLIEAPDDTLKHRSFNVTGMSFTPEELANAIKEYIPNFEITYKPDFRDAIARSWPQSLDDSAAREEWGWGPEFPFDKMVVEMLDGVSEKLGIPYK